MPQWSNMTEEMEKLFRRMIKEAMEERNPRSRKPPQMTQELPKQDLLAKLLAMTTSSNDGEALVAVRKANALMSAAGWTWEMLIASKIKIVENPFANLGDPREGRKTPRQEVNQPTASKPYTPPPPPPPTILKPPVNSATLLTLDDHCYCCGLGVKANAGWTFFPSKYNLAAPVGRHAICDICNSTMNLYISRNACPHQVPPRVVGKRSNQYPGFCYCCGTQVSQLQGFIFKPFDFNSGARNAWATICTPCNTPGRSIADHPAKHSKVFKPGLIDL